MWMVIPILAFAAFASLVLLCILVAAAFTRRAYLWWACGVLWFSALLAFTTTYSSARTVPENLLLGFWACGMFIVIALPIIAIGALVALLLKKLSTRASGDTEELVKVETN